MYKNKFEIKLSFSFILLSFILIVTCGFSSGHFIYNNNFSKSISKIDTTFPGTLTPVEAYNLILENKNNPEFVILDVRTKAEVDSGYIEGSRNIDYNSPDFKEEISKLDRKNTYILYCKGGGRSNKAKNIMEELGFTRVMHIGGGIKQWIIDSLPIIK